MWCFEQEQSLGGSNVSTNVRMTVIKLRSGGLFVHAPIAATRYCNADTSSPHCHIASFPDLDPAIRCGALTTSLLCEPSPRLLFRPA